MNLQAIRTEILNHGFDPTLFNAGRLNQYINDGLNLIARRVDYYIDEGSYQFQTQAGTATMPLWADPSYTGGSEIIYLGGDTLARVRSLWDTDRNVEMEAVSLRDIDRSSIAQGAPGFYALDARNLHLYPTPDGVYNLELRYWKMPPALSRDTDVPLLPTDWHHLLWVYGCAICYEAEDDPQNGQYWMQRFQTELAEFAADQKFPNTDYPTQANSMWEPDKQLSNAGWALYWGY